MLETLAAMSIGKLILLGALTFIIGIPALIFITGIIIVASLSFSPHPPWKSGDWHRERTGISLKTHVLGWGMFFIAVGLGILVALASGVQIWGIIGLVLLFGGISLIIFYFIAARAERKRDLAE